MPPPKKTVNCVTTSKQGATNNEISNWSLYQRNRVSTVQHLSNVTQTYHSSQFQNLFNTCLTLILSSEMGCFRQGIQPQCSIIFLFVPCIFLGEPL